MILLIGWMAVFGADQKGMSTVETKTAKITVSTKKVGLYEVGAMPTMMMFYAKVENPLGAAFEIDPTKFFLKTPEGKALRCLSAEEATQVLLGQTATMRSALGMGIGGGMNGRQIIQAQEQQAVATIKQRMLAPGIVPATTFREGVVYCEGTGEKQPRPVSLHLVGLSDDPVSLVW
jgi:hypothetical protein